jgi:hypothetical protein
MDLSGGTQQSFPWAEYQPELTIPAENQDKEIPAEEFIRLYFPAMVIK